MMNHVIKYIVLEQLISENRVNQTSEKYPCIPPTIINYLSENDPSGNNKYLEWMTKQLWSTPLGHVGDNSDITTWLEDIYYVDALTQPKCSSAWEDEMGEDFDGIRIQGWVEQMCEKVLDSVRYFHRFSQSLEKKDINQYTLDTLDSVLTTKILKVKEKELSRDITKIFENDDWLIMSPKSHTASCVYGANTQWCVTMKNNPVYFERYTRDSFYLIFVINKKENRKWAINTSKKLDDVSDNGDIKLNLPWHREVDLRKYGTDVKTRFPDSKHNKSVEQFIRSRFQNNDSITTYWDSQDEEIGWDRFIKESKLPQNLQELLKAVEKKIIITFARKKKGEIAHEINQQPVRLKKGDRVKFLASGHGIFRGDEGIVTATKTGAPGRQKNLTNADAGVYHVYVPTREPYRYSTDRITNDAGEAVRVKVIVVNGNYLQKIDKK